MDVRAGYFTVVMATGITAAALRAVGLPQLADGLLAMAAASFLVLAVLLVAACWRRPGRAVDRSSPGAAFAAFAVTAACAVVGRDLVSAGLTGPAALPAVQVLAALGGASWLALTALVPVRLAVASGERPVLADVGGTWYLWTVATQSLAIIAVFLHAAGVLTTRPAVVVALSAWLAGILLYVATTGLEAARLCALGPGPAGSRTSYWVAMGAASISVLAGAEVLDASGAGAGARTAISATSTGLWAVASGLLLVLAWRTAAVLLRRPLRPRYHAGAWLVVFPLGMYATASLLLGQAAGLPWLHGVGTVAAWVAVAAWTAVAASAVLAASQAVSRTLRPAVPPGHGRARQCSRRRPG
jgi:tellurite resistance protein TehA-like permease